MSDVPGDSPATEDLEPTTLPESVWLKLVPLAATVLPAVRPDDLPRSLRRFARFTPARRAKLAAPALRTELIGDPLFRQRIADLLQRSDLPLPATVSDTGTDTNDDPAEAAAVAFLLRPDGWTDLIDVARDAESHQREEQDSNALVDEAQRRATAAEHDRAVAEREAEKLRTELAELRSEIEQLRRQHRAALAETRAVKQRERKASDMLSAERGRLRQAETTHSEETRQLQSQLDEMSTALERARRGARDARSLHEARLWLLLETISGAATGLRRELALDPAERSPADIVADAEGLTDEGEATRRARTRALDADDPARLDELLTMPRAHLIIDGYNVTIGGYGGLTLEQQRQRLVNHVAGLRAQSGAEVTVVFDGADVTASRKQQTKGVRVLFSRKGRTADELIRELVRNEPPGRPLIVVSSDKEVADGTRRLGAYPLPSSALLRKIERRD
ncbi:NYN domain-containing protein [Stackebrandtia soli]|uniref:NYN domain-containing protein n=1 Tax=Stackebrandtia soli TaxID=1892856 RepID=UPI0039EB05E8